MPPKNQNRIGKKAFQVFVDPAILNRFRSACALVDKEHSEVAETLMAAFADDLKIPVQPVDDERHTARPRK